MDHEPLYSIGNRVQLRSDRARVGEIVRPPQRAGGEYWYLVEFLDASRDRHCESALERFVARATPENLFASRSFGDADDLLRLATFQKLAAPLDNTIYAAFASRTEFYPHQYKPLLKFIDSRRQRLLIADEVGLGKTIEAGLIMIELRARHVLDHALIVCPSSLREKWREEMWRRFDEEFTILDTRGLHRLYMDFEQRERISIPRAIVSLETIRQRDNLPLLERMPIPWDLVVFDEAHHLRNTGTLTHRSASVLCDGAAGVLMLTATPIQLGNENLFRLLQLLAPDEFTDYLTFVEQLEANAPVVETQRILGGPFPPDLESVRAQMARLGSGARARFFASNPLYERIIVTAAETDSPTRNRVARLAEDLKDLNLIGHIFTRTRKREVMTPAFRRAVVRRKEMTPAERRFYDAVTNLVREGAGGNLYFGPVMAQRQVASCMQAARKTFTDRAQLFADDGDIADLTLLDDLEDAPMDVSSAVIGAAEGLGSTDTKFDMLLEAIRELEAAEPGRPVIVFSFFRATLDYLSTRLSSAGFACGVIHGGTKSDPTGKEDVRGDRIRAFRRGEFQILLSSEVGSEGLDFEFCHAMVNYDLPWNPMRVEQRIGRLDRLGQKSDTIIIVNLSLAGTIEDRILRRLYERIKIFERSLGDLEAILGEQLQELARDLLSRQLSEGEEEERIDRAAHVLEQRLVDLDRLERESSRLLGADHYFDEQLERARTGGEILSPRDLYAFVSRFLDRHYPQSRLTSVRGAGYRLQVDGRLETAIRQLPDDTRKNRLLHRIAAGNGSLRLAFDPADARRDDQIELIVGRHPLLRLATDHYRQYPEELHPVSAIEVERSELVPPGQYIYALEEIEIRGARMLRRMEPFFYQPATGDPLGEVPSSHLFGLMLRGGLAWTEPPEFAESDGRDALLEADDKFCERLAMRRAAARERAASMVQARLASLEISHQNSIRRIEARLQRATDDQKAYRQLMEGQLRAAQNRFDARVAEVRREAELDMSARLIGCGVVNVIDHG